MVTKYVYNNDKKALDDITHCQKAILSVTNNFIELGYVTKSIYYDLFCIDNVVYYGIYENVKDFFIFDENIGYYIPITETTGISKLPGLGGFPYSFARNYEAIFNFNVFSDKQAVNENKEYWAAKYLSDFTFGFEFETSCGYIPQMECYKNGLIPLRDGSITGLEYSSVVLDGNKGLNLLHQQLEQLKAHCRYDKECSLHIHVGGFPVYDKHILALYKVAKVFEKKITPYMPKWTYSTRYYKASRKDYCKKLWEDISTFDQLYLTIAEQSYQRNLYENHPADPDRVQKWRVNSRYRWINLVNMLCYKGPKTVEFRFLRPTFDETKIVFWLLLLTSIMRYAIKLVDEDKDVDEELKTFTLTRFINEMFEIKDAKQIKLFLKDLKVAIAAQNDINDYYGGHTELENYSNLII
jgi:hypothetical protein